MEQQQLTLICHNPLTILLKLTLSRAMDRKMQDSYPFHGATVLWRRLQTSWARNQNETYVCTRVCIEVSKFHSVRNRQSSISLSDSDEELLWIINNTGGFEGYYLFYEFYIQFPITHAIVGEMETINMSWFLATEVCHATATKYQRLHATSLRLVPFRASRVRCQGHKIVVSPTGLQLLSQNSCAVCT